MQKEALAFWNAIKGKCSQLYKEMARKTLQCERYDVTTAPDGSKIGVTLPFGDTELKIPYSAEVASAVAGDTVLVIWWGSLSTAKAWCFGSGPAGSSGGGGTGGTSDHRELTNRDAANQHPMGAITGLTAALAGKQPAGNYLTDITSENIESALGYKPANPSEYLPLTGGTLTGNLSGKYLQGTWLQTSAATNLGSKPDKIAVLDGNGWVYWRSPSDIKGDINADYVLNVKDYGAKGNGTTDDTAAIQAALDNGGTIYFPAGRYKTTSKLTAIVPARLVFTNPYPTSGSSDNATALDTGARLETYSAEGGLLVGDSVQIDGLALRAMTGFHGVLLEYDGTQGIKSYPTTARFENIRLDSGSNSACPTAMFALKCNGNYGLIVDNVALGNKFKNQYCTYGVKMAVDATNWANSCHFRDIVTDVKASYPFYVENTGGSGNCKNFTFENICIQAEKFTDADTIITGHVNCVTLKNIHEVSVIGCKIWDVSSATITGDVVSQTNCTKMSVVGSDDYWMGINTMMQTKAAMAAVVSNNADQYPSCAAVKSYVDANTPTITDAQVGAAVEDWMDAHATPTEVTSKNLYNPNDGDVVDGYIQAGGNIGTSTTIWTTGYIAAAAGDVIYTSKNGAAMNAPYVGFYDAAKRFISRDGTNAAVHTVPADNNIAYIRVSIKYTAAAKTDPVMIALNDSDLTYAAYGTHVEGGLGQYLILVSPNGTRYTLAVDNNGNLSTKAFTS